ncbi:MFS transporter [Tenggerimyces flavus]|uniref:MFS transporter n=1 Tax=Tenggerimyces flavus TaxID=1708749 RepID=A0ABV7YMG1_9ACTN|nr:MFS transporter [Tenggerimyces flavus]MBM7786325.1 MFS family permease [Tenggerimyces flavus]
MRKILLGTTQVLLIAAITLPLLGVPAIQREFGSSQGDVALMIAAYGLAFGGLLLAGGRLADLGGRRTFLAGLAIFAAGSLAAALAPSFALLLAARFGQGIGAALVAPAAMVLLRQLTPDPARRAKALAAWGVLSGIGATFGNLLSGVVLTWGSWRVAFLAPAVIAAAAALAGWRLFEPTTARPARRRIDALGALLATATMTLLSYGLLNNAYVAIGGAVVLGVGFVLVERRTADPVLPLGFLADRTRVGGLAAIFVTAASMGTMWFMTSLYLQQVKGLSPILTSLAFLPYVAVQLGTSTLVSRVVGRFGARRATPIGLGLAAVGMGLLSRIEPDSPYVGVFLAGLLVFVAGASLAFSGAMVAATSTASEQQAGLAGGVANLAMEAGPTVGLAFLVSLAASYAHQTAGYAAAFGVAAIAFVLTAVGVAIALRQPHKKNEEKLHEYTVS